MVVALWLQFTAHFNVCMETKALINLRNIITNEETQKNEAGNKFGVKVRFFNLACHNLKMYT